MKSTSAAEHLKTDRRYKNGRASTRPGNAEALSQKLIVELLEVRPETVAQGDRQVERMEKGARSDQDHEETMSDTLTLLQDGCCRFAKQAAPRFTQVAAKQRSSSARWNGGVIYELQTIVLQSSRMLLDRHVTRQLS